MAIAVQCGACSRAFRVPDVQLGRPVKCQGCGKLVAAEGLRVRDFDIFISYSKQDQAAAFQICSTLESDGLSCWIAPRNVPSGASWAAAIIDAIGQCPVVILVYSSHTNASQQVLREVERATARGASLLPVRLQDSPMAPELEYYLSTPHWFDALTSPLDAHLPELKRCVRAMLQKPTGAQAPSASPMLDNTSAQTSERRLAWLFTRLALSRMIALLVLLSVCAGGVAAAVWWQGRPVLEDPGVVIEDMAWTESGSTAVLTLPGNVTMEFVKITTATFQMGSLDDAPGHFVDELDHEVTLNREYWIGKTEVTQQQWRAVMETNPSHFEGDTLPVESVSWLDCKEFCARLNLRQEKPFRLPTEAEWERACRAGSTTAYSFGDDTAKVGDFAWYLKNSDVTSHPVGQLKPNDFGLYDMYGNVAEWCSDWYGAYLELGQVDPRGVSTGSMRVVRGGAWNTQDALQLRSPARSRDEPSKQDSTIGFRCVRDVY